MRYLFGFIVYLSLLISLVLPQSFAANLPVIEISISTSSNVKRAFNDATQTTPCYLLTIEQIKHLYRAELELMIACKAIYSAGVIPKLTIVSTPNYLRSLSLVESGKVHMSAETIWQEEINQDKMFFSNAVVTDEFLEKGIYALSDHPLFNEEQLDLSKYRGLTVNNWFKDVAAIKTITDNVYFTYRYSSIYSMLKIKRADFTLLAFPATENLTIVEEEGTFKPVPNVKVTLSGNRHFILSKQKSDSKMIVHYLNAGLEKMRTTGELQAVFQTSGIVNKQVKHWKVLNNNPLLQ